MLSYAPRPGSKTEAAVAFITGNGGEALCTEIRDAVDIDLKNQHASFSAAVDAGLLERCDLAGGAGYKIVGAKSSTAPAAKPAETRAESLARELQVTKAVPARRSRSMAQKPKVIAAAELKKPKPLQKQKRKNGSPPPMAAPDEPFRCGFFSDGTLRLEGCNQLDGTAAQVTLSTAAARVLANYLREHKS